MSALEVRLIAVEIRKWELENSKLYLTSYIVINDEERNLNFGVGILQPPEMVEEYFGKLRKEIAAQSENTTPQDVNFDSETFLRQKLYNYFKRIMMELNNPRRKRGQPKMIFTTHMDIYNENQDISFLPERIQFFVVLNWARKYYNREDYKRAIDPLRQLIKLDPEYGLGYMMLARSLKKIRKYDEAMRLYEKYAEVDQSTEAWLELAKSLRKGKLFERSEEIYQRILKEDPTNREARIGLAQIRYANKNEEFWKILEELYQEDPVWLRQWLVEEFNFRIYVPEKTILTPVQAAKMLGYKQTFELTQRAFKNELPSHFNPSKARITFYREELENWAEVMNRFKCLEEEIKLYPERIDMEEEPEVEIINTEPDGHLSKKDGKELTKVEEILMEIRARKAQRLAANASLKDGKTAAPLNGNSPRGKSGGGAKRSRKSASRSTE